MSSVRRRRLPCGNMGYRQICARMYSPVRGLVEALLQRPQSGDSIFLFRAAKGSPLSLQRLEGVRNVPLYDMHSALQAKDGAGTMLEKMDYLTFSSAGGVQLFLERYGGIPERTVPVYIGPISARTLKERCRESYFW